MNTVEVKDIKRIHIAGAGIMGASMAQIFARHDYDVIVYDAFEKGLESGRKLIETNQKAAIAAGDISAEDSALTIRRISLTMDKETFKTAQFVVEAIVEKMDVKHLFWEEISSLAPSDAILTTNTSGLSITEIAKAVKRPARFAGFHWVNPPHIVPLVEIIHGAESDPTVAAKIVRLAELIGKRPVTIKKDAPGFILNRIQFCILREAMHIVESGIAEKEDVDSVLKYGLGMRYACLGPFEVADLGGLDTFYSIAKYLFADLSDAKEPHKMLADLYNAGAFGVKSGRGYYDYAGGRAEEVIRKRDTDFLKIANCLYKEK